MDAARAPLPPLFTRRQRGGIRRVARRFAIPRDQHWDFVHDVWVKVCERWIHVPRVEPSMRRYIFRVARNLAVDLLRRYEDDVMTGCLLFSQLSERRNQDPEKDEDDDWPGMADPRATPADLCAFAHQLAERADRHDAEAALWLARAKIGGDTVPEIAADVGQPEARIYKRIARLQDRLGR